MNHFPVHPGARGSGEVPIQSLILISILLLGVEAFAIGEIELAPLRVWGKVPERRAEDAELPGQRLERSETDSESVESPLIYSPSATPRRAGGKNSPLSFLIRGHDAHESRDFLEGIPLTSAAFHQSSAHLIPSDVVSAVDLYPSGIPLFLADDGLGGGMNYRVDEETAPAFRIKAQGGSFRFGEAFVDSGGRPWRIGFNAKRSDENYAFFDDNGTPFNSADDASRSRGGNGFWRATLFPRVRVFGTNLSSLRVLSLLSAGNTGIAGEVRQPLRGELSDLHALAGAIYQVRTPSTMLSTTVYGRLEKEELTERSGAPSLVPVRSRSYTLGGKAEFSWGDATRWTVIAGAETESFSHAEKDFGKGRWKVPLGFGLDGKWGAWRVSPAILAHLIQYDVPNEVSGIPFPGEPRKSYRLFSPRMSVSYSPWRNALFRVAGGRFHRAPTLVELFGAPTGFTPSSGLITESASRFEYGVDLVLPIAGSIVRSARLSFTQHFSLSEDLIAYTRNSQSTFIAVNIGKSQIIGEEAMLEITSSWDTKLLTSLAFLHTVNLSDYSFQNGKALPGRPDYRWTVDFSYARGSFFAGYLMELTGPLYWDLINSKRLSPVAEHSIRVGLRTKSLGTFQLEGRNLTDTIASPSTYGGITALDNTTGFPGFPAPGRRFYLTWRYET